MLRAIFAIGATATLSALIGANRVAAQSFRPRADLPPLLEFLDGSRVVDTKAFARRREEIRALLCEHFVRTFPSPTPGLEKAEVLEEKQPGVGSG